MLKKLVTGQLSLLMTFWGWGVCGDLVIGLIGLVGVYAGHTAIVPVAYLFETVLFSAVLSGITCMLRRKITVWGALAFFVVLIQVVVGIVMTTELSSLLFK